MNKIIEHTYGNHIYMKMRLDNSRIEEIDVYLLPDGSTKYITSADHYITDSNRAEKQEIRNQIIEAFKMLY